MKVLTVYAHPSPASFCHAVLKQFTKGLSDGGHANEVVDLYGIKFNPVLTLRDMANFVDDSMPADVLERMNLKQLILDNCGNPLLRFTMKRWLRNKDLPAMVKMIRRWRPKDIVAQQQKVSQAQGLAFISPVYWVHFPAILKGWVERVFTLGYAFSLKPEGWRGDIKGRVPLLRHEKVLIINTTLFKEEDYQGGLGDSMKRLIDDFGFRYPGIRKVQHVYFYAVGAADDDTRQSYLKRAYLLGKEFGQ